MVSPSNALVLAGGSFVVAALVRRPCRAGIATVGTSPTCGPPTTCASACFSVSDLRLLPPFVASSRFSVVASGVACPEPPPEGTLCRLVGDKTLENSAPADLGPVTLAPDVTMPAVALASANAGAASVAATVADACDFGEQTASRISLSAFTDLAGLDAAAARAGDAVGVGLSSLGTGAVCSARSVVLCAAAVGVTAVEGAPAAAAAETSAAAARGSAAAAASSGESSAGAESAAAGGALSSDSATVSSAGFAGGFKPVSNCKECKSGAAAGTATPFRVAPCCGLPCKFRNDCDLVDRRLPLLLRSRTRRLEFEERRMATMRRAGPDGARPRLDDCARNLLGVLGRWDPDRRSASMRGEDMAGEFLGDSMRPGMTMFGSASATGVVAAAAPADGEAGSTPFKMLGRARAPTVDDSLLLVSEIACNTSAWLFSRFRPC